MDGCMDAYIYIYICVCVFMYVCMVGPQARLFFPRAERRHGRDEDGDEVGTWQNTHNNRLSYLYRKGDVIMKTVSFRSNSTIKDHDAPE